MKYFSGILNIIPFTAAIITAAGFSGCYTVLWTPDQELPEQQPQQEVYDNGYYPGPLIGDYYDVPWWYSVPVPATSKTADRNKPTEVLRNEVDGRGVSSRLDIPSTPPPSRNVDQTNNGNSNVNAKKENSSSSSGRQKVESTNSNSNSDSSRGSSSDSDKNLRNNNGDRNSNGRK